MTALEPMGPLRRGDYVTVMVLGERRRARVVDPYTSLGNVSVDLEQSIEWHGGNGFDTPIRRLVRERAEVHRIERRCEECWAPWADAQCRRCGNRTWEEKP